jgi:hypothetical protein
MHRLGVEPRYTAWKAAVIYGTFFAKVEPLDHRCIARTEFAPINKSFGSGFRNSGFDYFDEHVSR